MKCDIWERLQRVSKMKIEAMEALIVALGGPLQMGGPIVARSDVRFGLLPHDIVSRTDLYGAGMSWLGAVQVRADSTPEGALVYRVETLQQRSGFESVERDDLEKNRT